MKNIICKLITAGTIVGGPCPGMFSKARLFLPKHCQIVGFNVDTLFSQSL